MVWIWKRSRSAQCVRSVLTTGLLCEIPVLHQLAREEVWACGWPCGQALELAEQLQRQPGPSRLRGDGEVDGLWPVPIPPPSLNTELCRELLCSQGVRTQVVPPLNHREEQLPELLK